MTTQTVLTEGINTLVYPLPNTSIDPERVRAEYEAVIAAAPLYDQNKYRNEGWKGIALYSGSGKNNDLRVNYDPHPTRTPMGELCPYICNEVLPQFKSRWYRAGFYKLESGKTIGEHRDLVQSTFHRTMVRIHIPVITDPDVIMMVERQPYHFPVGTAWYFDATARHAVQNNSDIDRIHIMADFEYGPELEEFLLPPTMGDKVRFAGMSAKYHAVKVIKPFYARGRNFWYDKIRRRPSNAART